MTPLSVMVCSLWLGGQSTFGIAVAVEQSSAAVPSTPNEKLYPALNAVGS